MADPCCALCGATDALAPFSPAGAPAGLPAEARSLLSCGACRAQLQPGAALEAGHWRCLQTSAWSPEPAVQVVAWRLLGRLDAAWAAELRAQLWLEPEAAAWAEAEAADAPEHAVRVLDSNGAELHDGDSVVIIKDLDVRGAGFVAKRGTVVKGIRLGDDPTHVEGKVNGTAIFLKTAFLRRS